MRKGRDGGKTGRKKNGEKKEKKKKRQMKIVTTTSLPAVDCPNADRWNAAPLCQHKGVLEKTEIRQRKEMQAFRLRIFIGYAVFDS